MCCDSASICGLLRIFLCRSGGMPLFQLSHPSANNRQARPLTGTRVGLFLSPVRALVFRGVPSSKVAHRPIESKSPVPRPSLNTLFADRLLNPRPAFGRNNFLYSLVHRADCIFAATLASCTIVQRPGDQQNRMLVPKWRNLVSVPETNCNRRILRQLTFELPRSLWLHHRTANPVASSGRSFVLPWGWPD